jgi:hypothetical protein
MPHLDPRSAYTRKQDLIWSCAAGWRTDARIKAFGRYHPPGLSETFGEELMTVEADRHRQAVLDATRSPTPESTALLLESLQDEDALVREWAVEGLVQREEGRKKLSVPSLDVWSGISAPTCGGTLLELWGNSKYPTTRSKPRSLPPSMTPTFTSAASLRGRLAS